MMAVAAAHAAGGSVRVWSPYVRLFHWTLVAAVGTAWLTAEDTRSLHENAGYAAAALVGGRAIGGLVGSRYARFSQFVRGPAATLCYLGDILRGRERRHLGHNPAGAAMIVLLLASVALAALTGWMQTTDEYWGVAWVEETHEFAGNAILTLGALHVAGVLLASLRHRENLVRAMITGRKRPALGGDIA